jgi:hypothetical protein
MPLKDLSLSFMTFPQRFADGAIDYRMLVIPTGNPFNSLGPGLPPFKGTTWRLRTVLLAGTDGLWTANPSAGAVQPPEPLTLTPPADAAALFQALKMKLDVKDEVRPPSERLVTLGDTRIKKHLPPSYTSAFAFERSRTNDAGVGDEFACALRDVEGGRKEDPPPNRDLTWGKVIAFALRQPELARALGLLYVDLSLAIDDVTALKDGGWLYVELDPNAPGQIAPVNKDAVRSYAARLPPLADARPLFAAVLFPVGQAKSGYDPPLAEAAIYADGFAKILHAFQPDSADAASSGHNELKPATDCGIDVGWDDEQVVIWHNRQIAAQRIRLGGASPDFVEAPLGVAGYRIDARAENDPDWHSLCRVHSVNAAGNKANLVFPPPPDAPVFAKTFIGELMVEPAPVRNLHAIQQAAWLPRYFARWAGRSLVVNDDTLYRLTGGAPKTAEGQPLEPGKASYAPDGATIDLRYGTVYEFRCRLADLSGGGPVADDSPVEPAPAPTTKLRFLRHVPPKALRVATVPKAPEVGAATDVIRKIDKVSLRRPLTGYPDFVFAGVDRAKVLSGANNLFTKVDDAKAQGTAIGIADPDVAEVLVSVQVRLPAHDSGPKSAPRDGEFREIYNVTRKFAAYDFAHPLAEGPTLELVLDYVDEPQIDALIARLKAQPLKANDKLPIPRARDVRLRLTPLCAAKPDYYADDDVQVGLISDILTRAPATAEPSLFVPDVPQHQLNAIFLQPGPNVRQLLAQQLSLSVNDLSFGAKPGRRVVFGASKALRHTLSGDSGVITFAAESELIRHWVIALILELDRDWTWDGLEDLSFAIARIDELGQPEHVVGQIDLRFAVDALALAGDDAQFPDRRARTRLIFFDAIDPNPPLGTFPKILHPSWIVRPRLKKGLPAEDNTLDVRLPVAAPPQQMPKLKSAGIALSPYQHDESYAATEPRRRKLWLEFEEPVADENDALFARVLAYGPDPLLSGDLTHDLMPPQTVPGDFDPKLWARDHLPHTDEPDPPALPIDPEWIRVIVPGQPEDSSGRDCMFALERGASDVHYLLPLPDVTPDAPELFGFWTYEIRVGHKLWSLAQAWPGRPLRVAGVQHPPPALTLSVHRVLPTAGPAGVFEPPPRIVVTAPHATAVYADRKLTNPEAGDPRTRIWVMLYAQVMQADGSTWRNVLLGRTYAARVFDRRQVEDRRRASTRDVIGLAEFEQRAVEVVLERLGLPVDAALSVLAVELLPGDGLEMARHQWAAAFTTFVTSDAPELPPANPFHPQFGVAAPAMSDPLGADLGTIRSRRILRTSPLTPVPPAC